MLSEQTLSYACAVERQMHTSLIELDDLTSQLADAVSRQDQVSVRLFLSMRQEEIDRMLGYKAALRRHCAELPAQDGARLRLLLTGKPGDEPPDKVQALLKQVNTNRNLLEKICRADQSVSRRFGGSASFYAGKDD